MLNELKKSGKITDYYLENNILIMKRLDKHGYTVTIEVPIDEIILKGLKALGVKL